MPRKKNSERERMFILQELAATDPVICRIDARRVSEAYQQLLRVAPSAADEKEIVREFLRRVTAPQNIVPFRIGRCGKPTGDYYANSCLGKPTQIYPNRSARLVGQRRAILPNPKLKPNISNPSVDLKAQASRSENALPKPDDSDRKIKLEP
jgi:hypothetical protein